MNITPEQFGAVGDGMEDDAIPLQKWADAVIGYALAGNESIGIVSRIYATSKQIRFISTKGFSLIGFGNNVGFKTHPEFSDSTDGRNILYVSGLGLEATTARSIYAATYEGTRELPVDNVVLLAPGDAVAVSVQRGAPGTIQRATIARIMKIGGNIVSLDQPVQFPIDPAIDISNVRVCKLCPDVKIENLSFYGLGPTGPLCSGPYLGFLENPTIRHIRTADLCGPQYYGRGIDLQYILGGTIKDVLDQRSGGQVTSGSSFFFWRCGQLDIRGLTSLESLGYAALIQISNSRLQRLYSSRCTGRGFELYCATGNVIEDITVTQSGTTGLSIVYGCHNNVFTKVNAIYNAHQNVWLNGTENQYQRFFGVTSFGAGVWPDVYVGVADYGCAFYGLDPRATKWSGVADTIFSGGAS